MSIETVNCSKILDYGIFEKVGDRGIKWAGINKQHRMHREERTQKQIKKRILFILDKSAG